MKLITERLTARQLLFSTITAVFLVALTAPALAQTAPETRGAHLVQALNEGKKRCAELSDTEFEAVGEFAMGRTVGSPRAHAAMNRLMTAMMGRAGEERMHQFMGRRFAGCGGGAVPAAGGFGPMMGALGMMGGFDQGGARGLHGGSMMGGDRPGVGSSQDDDEGPSATAMVGMMLVLIAAVALAVFLLRRRRGSSGALNLLQQRFARGELSPEEYKRQRQPLQGGD